MILCFNKCADNSMYSQKILKQIEQNTIFHTISLENINIIINNINVNLTNNNISEEQKDILTEQLV
jgi:hypothetical protein